MLKKKITREMLRDAASKLKQNIWILDEAKEKQELKTPEFKPFQHSLPQIEFVGNMDESKRQEALDAVISFLVDEYLKDYDCHVSKFKGKTYITMKPTARHFKHREKREKKRDWGFSESGVPYIEINGHKFITTQEMLQEYTSRPRIADEYSRNSSRYYVYGKGKKKRE